MRISDWSSDVCSSDLLDARRRDLIGTQCDDALVGVAAFSTALFRASSRFVAGCPIVGRLVPGVLATTGSQQKGERRRPRTMETLHHCFHHLGAGRSEERREGQGGTEYGELSLVALLYKKTKKKH